MNRKTIVSLVSAIAIVLLGILIMKKMEASKTNPERVSNKVTKTISVIPFTSDTISFELPVYGKLSAINKSELYSEVSGILLPNSNQFLEGVTFRKGQTLLHLDDTEARATLMSQKSSFLNAVSKVLPDLKLDFPKDYDLWKVYLEKLDLNKETPVPPAASEKKSELYLTSQGVYSSYYNLKTAEARIDKYQMIAPYNGTVTESNIKPGTLVRAGQKMGEFVGIGSYELEVYISTRYLSFIKKGNKVELSSPDLDQQWTGTISRINHSVDQETQSVGVFIKVTGNNLRDGMYLNGKLTGIHFNNAMRIARKLVFDNNHIYTLEHDSILQKTEIEVIEFIQETALIKTPKTDQKLVSETVAGAYPGLIVNVKQVK